MIDYFITFLLDTFHDPHDVKSVDVIAGRFSDVHYHHCSPC